MAGGKKKKNRSKNKGKKSQNAAAAAESKSAAEQVATGKPRKTVKLSGASVALCARACSEAIRAAVAKFATDTPACEKELRELATGDGVDPAEAADAKGVLGRLTVMTASADVMAGARDKGSEIAEVGARMMAEAAKEGSVNSQWLFGLSFHEGIALEKDMTRAMQAYTLAARGGSGEAARSVAQLLAGSSREEDAKASADMWELAVQHRGNPDDKVGLALAFLRGAGREKDPARALALVEEAAAEGSSRGKTALGELLEEGKGPSGKRDPERALALYLEAAAAGHVPALVALGRGYHAGTLGRTDHKLALKHFTEAAKQGSGEALNCLGVMNKNGQGGLDRDPRAAARFWKEAADHGHPGAMYNLATLLYNHELPVVDLPMAAALYRAAAARGHPRAAGGAKVVEEVAAAAGIELAAVSRIAKGPLPGVSDKYPEPLPAPETKLQSVIGSQMVINGLKLAESGQSEAAVDHLRTASRLGNSAAQVAYGQLLETGASGLDQGPAEAQRLYRMAEAQGYQRAKFALASLVFRGTTAHKHTSEAERMLRELAEDGECKDKELAGEAAAALAEFAKVRDAGNLETHCCGCGKAPPPGATFAKCARCNWDRYCSRECQKKVYKCHKLFCQPNSA